MSTDAEPGRAAAKGQGGGRHETGTDETDAGAHAGLTAALRTARASGSVAFDTDPAYVAARLCDASFGDRTLLGLLAGGTEAVYHSGRTRCVAAVPVTDQGPDLGRARPLGQAVDDPAVWHRHVGGDHDWAWVGPGLD